MPSENCAAGRELQLAVADVLPDGETGDVGPAVGLGHPVGPSADDGDELDLPVDVAGTELDVVERAGQRGRELGEGGRDVGQLGPGLFGVAAVVESDREDLAGCRHGVAELGLDQRAGGRVDGARRTRPRRPSRRTPPWRWSEATVGHGGEVGDAIGEHDGDAAVAVGDLHEWTPWSLTGVGEVDAGRVRHRTVVPSEVLEGGVSASRGRGRAGRE